MTNNMNPKNLMMLGLLGLGAYFLMTRKASAMTVGGSRIASRPPTTYPSSPTTAITGGTNSGTIAAGLNLLGRFFQSAPVNYSKVPDQTTAEDSRLARYESAANISTGPDQSAAEDARLARYAGFGESADNPTTLITSDPQLYASTGGFLDSQ